MIYDGSDERTYSIFARDNNVTKVHVLFILELLGYSPNNLLLRKKNKPRDDCAEVWSNAEY